MSIGSNSPIRRSLGRALVAILCLGLLLTLALAAMLPLDGPVASVLVLFPINVLIYLGAGLLAWYYRPSNRMGALILLTGVWVFLGGAGNTNDPVLATLGTIASSLPLAGLVHLLLAFPAGRLQGRYARLTVMVAYVNSLVLGAFAYLFSPNPELPWLAIADVPQLARWGGVLQETVGFAVLLSTIVLLAHSLQRASRAERRVLVPLYSYGIAAMVLFLFAARVLRPFLAWQPTDVAALQLLVFCGVPVAFALGALRGGIARTGEIEELGAWLGEGGHTKLAIAKVLAQTLGDPSLEIWFWVPGRERFVDVYGADVGGAGASGADALDAGRTRGRGLEPVELDGRRIGAISYDAALVLEPELVQTAGRVIAITLDRERLVAELTASHRALQASRERLVEVADQERRRIAQDLHDGLQVQLVLLALEAQQLANASVGDGGVSVHDRATELRLGIDAAAAGLREVVHSVMPAALTQRGLSAAAEDLVDRMPVPTTLALGVADGECSPVVESTVYFVIAEALANAVKHARAGAIAVQLSRTGDVLHAEVSDNGDGGARVGSGSGLPGMTARVEALGGGVRVDSEPGRGTTIRAEIPCGW